MIILRTRLGWLFAVSLILLVSTVGAIDYDAEITQSGGSTSNLFSDSSRTYDKHSTSTIDLNVYPLSFARLNLVSEYSYYGNFINLSNLVYGGGFTIIPLPDSSRLSTYLEANIKKREYRDTPGDSTSLNANEFTGDQYDGKFGLGYSLGSNIQLRAGVAYSVSQYNIDGVIDREKTDITAGVNTTLLGSFGVDIEMGYSAGDYQKVNPKKSQAGVDTLVPVGSIKPPMQYSILLTDQLKSFYISPRLSHSIGRKTGMALTYSHRQFMDRDEDAIIYGYSSGFLSPWLDEFAGQAAVVKVKTYLIPRIITTVSAGFWEREHIRTVERDLKPAGLLGPTWTVNPLYAQDRTDWRRRFNFEVKWPLQLGGGATLEPSVQLDYTDNNSTVRVYDYDNLSVNGGVTARF